MYKGQYWVYKMNNKIKLKGNLRAYFRWPLILNIFFAILTLQVFLYNERAGKVCALYFVGFLIISICIYFAGRRRLYADLTEFALNYGTLQHNILSDMNLPFAILSMDGHMLWSNKEFIGIITNKKAAKRGINNIFPDILPDEFPKEGKDVEFIENYSDKIYRVVLRQVNSTEVSGGKDGKDLLPLDKMLETHHVILVFLYDTTQIEVLRKQVEEENLLVGLLYIDNYEETFTNDDVTQALSLTITERRINSFMSSIDAVSKKFEKDKYLFVFRQKYLPEIKARHFSVLEEVRTGINDGKTGACTISIGIGTGSNEFLERYNKARAAIDLALGRGGDQAVIKNEDSEEFFGGKQVQIERTTRVKARVKAHALKELIENKERVVVMGHSIGDVDSFGACVGIYTISMALKRKSYILLNECTKSVAPIRDSFAGNKYPNDMIIDSEQAKNLVDENTLLIIVDVNKANYTECPELIDMTQSVVVIDHHRQAGDAITKAMLFYIEPYASSACEMVAEISQYIDDGIKLMVEEANALYAGILIDTNYFTNKTGVRTFETMAFLKRNGADTVKLRKLFRDDMTEYRLRAEAIKNTEVYRDGFAIAVSTSEGVNDPTVLAAKVANELLDISGIKASFVLSQYNNRIYISARAIDEVNVQVMMEKLGGGGHINVAGAQLNDTDIEGAIATVKKAVDEEIMESEES